MQVLAEAEQALREMAERKSTHAPFGAPWESWPTAGNSSSPPPGGASGGSSYAGPAGHHHVDPGMVGGIMDVGKGAGFDEFDDFLDMLEVGE